MPFRHADVNTEDRSDPATAWWQSLEDAGDHPVEVPITCALTRFRLRSARDLLPTYLDYRRVVREAAVRKTPGLLRSVFLIEDPITFYSLSIWLNPGSIAQFGTNVPCHVEAARRVFRRVAYGDHRGPELWSTKWQLASVSNNLNWDDLDLRKVILGMTN